MQKQKAPDADSDFKRGPVEKTLKKKQNKLKEKLGEATTKYYQRK